MVTIRVDVRPSSPVDHRTQGVFLEPNALLGGKQEREPERQIVVSRRSLLYVVAALLGSLGIAVVVTDRFGYGTGGFGKDGYGQW